MRTLEKYFPKKIKTIESFYIDWENEKVVFIYTTAEDNYDEKILDLKSAHEVFIALKVYGEPKLSPLHELLNIKNAY
jgi:hypothetical protein